MLPRRVSRQRDPDHMRLPLWRSPPGGRERGTLGGVRAPKLPPLTRPGQFLFIVACLVIVGVLCSAIGVARWVGEVAALLIATFVLGAQAWRDGA
jgi:hypothetical protein